MGVFSIPISGNFTAYFLKKIFHIICNVLIYFQPIRLSFPKFLCYQKPQMD